MRKITRKHLEQFLAKHASQERTLDIGAGGSSYGRFFPNRYSIDIDPARKPDLVADAHRLPFKDGEFSTILCTEVLEHLRDPRTAIAEMRRVLRPGGTLILTTRFVYPIHDAPGDYWRFTCYGLRELFKEWNIVELVPETIDAETVAVLLQRLGFQTKMRFNTLSKLVTYTLARIAPVGDRLIVKRYGDIGKKREEDHILASGYYMVAKH
jgi:SAM-dependent methyltransferase